MNHFLDPGQTLELGVGGLALAVVEIASENVPKIADLPLMFLFFSSLGWGEVREGCLVPRLLPQAAEGVPPVLC